MALDGAFLHQLKKEIEERAVGDKVDKVYQPSKEEILLALRGRNGNCKLLFSARANSPRVHFTEVSPENPAAPPMFCMLLRKKLAGARLAGIRQPGLERALLFDFDGVSELGDPVRHTLVIEVMGRYSNIILVGPDGAVIDAVKRVNAQMSSERIVLPGARYELPPAQQKHDLLQTSPEAVIEAFLAGKEAALPKALLGVLQGVSPIVCRELQALACRGREATSLSLTEEETGRLRFYLGFVTEKIREGGKPVMVSDPTGKPIDFSFLEITQYGSGATTRTFSTYSELLDAFYAEKDGVERMRVKSRDLLKVLSNHVDRLSRKINAQREELAACAHREEWRVFGDLVNANLYRLEKGMPFADLENYFEEGMPLTRVSLDPTLTPAQNAQQYYKRYRRAQTAEQVLTAQIVQAEQEILYLDSVFDALSRAQTEKELAEIRAELAEEGYVRRAGGKKRAAAPLGPLHFETSDGLSVLVGRNNRQNDQLTLRTASKSDYWFHTKNIPGSHTVLLTGGSEPPARSVEEAALLAAFHSHAAGSSQVPVDYTQIKNVHKPQGAKPGMVIYDHYQTLYMTPLPERAEALRAKG